MKGIIFKVSEVELARPTYRPDIDGLRAIAVSTVIGFHAFPNIIPGGFVGVDIFFVISGFLISTIVFGNLEHNTFSIVEFYRRRVLRIFPALITVILTSMALGWLILLTDEYKQMGRHVAASSAFVQNFALWDESGYFDTAARTKPLLHLWSLAIEEQFYIFWPLLLAIVWMRKWAFLYITVTFAILSFCANIYSADSDSTAAFYSPISRFWELMIGGLLAFISLHRPDLIRKYDNTQSAFELACLVLGLMLINNERAFPGWWALLPTIGAFFMISAGPKAWFNRNVLSNRLFVAVGLISYPLYLWHWPLLSFAKIVRPNSGYKVWIALIGLAIILSVITYRYIEQVYRKDRYKLKSFFPLIAGMSFVLGAGLLINDAQIKPRQTFRVPYKHEWGFLNLMKVKFDPDGTGVYSLHQERELATLFIGDSQLAQYAERIFRVQNQDASRNGAIFAVGGGCPPIIRRQKSQELLEAKGRSA
jgi:peptidoglycan/LPS O-acetylase OafA/YrhL